MVECQLPKLKAAGSNPVSRSSSAKKPSCEGFLAYPDSRTSLLYPQIEFHYLQLSTLWGGNLNRQNPHRLPAKYFSCGLKKSQEARLPVQLSTKE